MARRFNNVNDVRRFLASVLNDLESGTIQADDARVRGYVASVLHKVLIDSSLEQRVVELENRLGVTNGG